MIGAAAIGLGAARAGPERGVPRRAGLRGGRLGEPARPAVHAVLAQVHRARGRCGPCTADSCPPCCWWRCRRWSPAVPAPCSPAWTSTSSRCRTRAWSPSRSASSRDGSAPSRPTSRRTPRSTRRRRSAPHRRRSRLTARPAAALPSHPANPHGPRRRPGRGSPAGRAPGLPVASWSPRAGRRPRAPVAAPGKRGGARPGRARRPARPPCVPRTCGRPAFRGRAARCVPRTCGRPAYPERRPSTGRCLLSLQQRPQQILVVVLAGFLGSGKTTLLNHLLRTARAPASGSWSTTSAPSRSTPLTVAGQVGSTVSPRQRLPVLRRRRERTRHLSEVLTRPASGIDVIVIEASGLAEPQELVRMVLASDNERIVYGGLVQVVDAAEFDATRARHPEATGTWRSRTSCVVNKGRPRPGPRTGAGPRRRRRTRRACRGRRRGVRADRPRAALRPRRQDRGRAGRRTPALLRGPVRRAYDAAHDHARHPHAAYDTVSFTAEAPPAPPAASWSSWTPGPTGSTASKGLRRLRQRRPPTARSARRRRFLRFSPQPWPPGEPRLSPTGAHRIRHRREALRKALDGCTVAGPHDVPDPHSMWGVLRYVPDPGDEAGRTGGRP